MEDGSIHKVDKPYGELQTHGKTCQEMGFHHGQIDDLIEVLQVPGVGDEVKEFPANGHI